jgi:hypothetical protein
LALIALFAEAEKGSFRTPLLIRSLEELLDKTGNPPQESQGIFFAIQALLYQRSLLFFRVTEEGFSKEDYFSGIAQLVKKKEKIHAIALPGVGDGEIFEAAHPLFDLYHCLLLTTEKDFLDYLMS